MTTKTNCTNTIDLARWEAFAAEHGGILVVGHGTRKASGAAQLLRLVDHIRERLPGVPVEGCFLELAFPTIGEGLVQLLARGCSQVISMPILLFSAGHARQDIPEEIRPAARSIGIRLRGQSAPLELSTEVLQLSATRFSEALGRANRAIAHDDSRVAIAMVGRGSSYKSAIAKMQRLLARRLVRTPVQWSGLGFFAAAKPTVRELLDRAARTDCDTIVIQPHLLFDGLLMDELRELHSEYSSQYPAKQWLLCETLGADARLAETYIRLAQRQL